MTRPSMKPVRTYNVNDIVLAKLKGYPKWPAQVIADSDAPKDVLKAKPARLSYLVQFFPAGDYSWSPPRDLDPLTTDDIEKFVDSSVKRSGGDLMKAYKIARDPSDWRAQRLANAKAIANGDSEDEMSENEPKKRKKAEKKAVVKEKPAAKKTEPKTKTRRKPAADAEESEQASESLEGLAQVKEWRQKLQRSFLGKNGVVAEEVAKCVDLFDHMEAFAMKTEWLVETKLGKVLRRIALLTKEEVPEDDTHRFRTRSQDLSTKWANENGSLESKPVDVEMAELPDTNPPAADVVEDSTEEAAATKPAIVEDAPSEAPKADEAKEAAPLEGITDPSNGTHAVDTNTVEPKQDAEMEEPSVSVPANTLTEKL